MPPTVVHAGTRRFWWLDGRIDLSHIFAALAALASIVGGILTLVVWGFGVQEEARLASVMAAVHLNERSITAQTREYGELRDDVKTIGAKLDRITELMINQARR
jgi:hypothetical protein